MNFLFRWVTRLLLLLVMLVLISLVVLKLMYGGGSPYPDTSTSPVRPAAALETLVSLDYPPGNVAVSADGRIFFNYHPFAQTHRMTEASVFEWFNGTARPYPDAAYQTRYQGVFGLTVDRQQRLWVIEPASLDHERTRLTAFDLSNNKVVFEHQFLPGEARFAQDLRVAPDGQTIYLADTGLFRFTSASLLVFDVATKTHHATLATSPAAQPQNWFIRTRNGPHRLGFGLITFSVGLDGIEVSPDGQWLYFAAMSHDTLYRVPTAALRDKKRSADEVNRLVERVGPKPLSDGITLDNNGDLVITDVENGSLARLTRGGKLETLSKSADIVWSDGVVAAPDGSLLFTDSAIPVYIDQLARPPTAESLARGRPYRIYRLRP